MIEDAIDTKLPNLRSTMSGDARLTEVNVQGRLFQPVGEKAKDAFPSWAFAATVWCTMCSLACCSFKFRSSLRHWFFRTRQLPSGQ